MEARRARGYERVNKMNWTKVGHGSYDSGNHWITDVRYMHEGDLAAIRAFGKNGWACGAYGEVWGTFPTLKQAKAYVEMLIAEMAAA